MRAWVFFFFSSRRRHTRFKCDWSSDVCSSDLLVFLASGALPEVGGDGAVTGIAVAGLGAVQQDQRAGAVFVESLWVRDVQHKVAFGTGARHACQHGAPLRGCMAA